MSVGVSLVPLGRVVGAECRPLAWQPAASTGLSVQCGMRRTIKECDGGQYVGVAADAVCMSAPI